MTTAAWVLVSVFFAVAVATFVGFAILSFKQTTPIKEDWKKFLSAFSGTALALSVGFGSLMLQQKGKLDEERAQAQRKMDDENAQMRARLLYSIAQKKFDLDIFKSKESLDQIAAHEVCDSNEEEKIRDEHLAQVHSSRDGETTKFARDIFDRLFSTSGYERGTLNRLLMETSLPTRINQDMLDRFLSIELELRVGGPLLLSQGFELSSINRSKTFCERFKVIKDRRDSLLEDAAKLQLATCVAYAIMGLPTDLGLEKSTSVFPVIDSLRSEQGEEKAARNKRFLVDVDAKIGDGKPDFQKCLALAQIDLDLIP